MDNLTVTEKYAICILKSRKNLYDDDILYVDDIISYLLMSMIVEMFLDGNIDFAENNNIVLTGKLPNSKYLVSFYTILKDQNKEQINIKNFIGLVISYAQIKDIIEPLKESLINKNAIQVTTEKKLIFTKANYIIDEDKFNSIIEEIRAEFLENGTITDELILLSSLLSSTKFLKDIFSKYENDKLKARLKEIDKTDISNKVKIAKSIITTHNVIDGIADLVSAILSSI